MKKIVLSILAITLLFSHNSAAHAGENSTHSAYRITSYNLGAIADNEKSASSSYSTDFKPLMITGNASDILNSEHVGRVFLGEAMTPASNTRGVAVAATFDASQNISLQGAFGVTRNLWSPDSLNYEKDSSWEANLGVIYKLLNNISYELHFGYMDTGNLFNDRSSYTNVESIIMISNQLTMSF
jgi:hypothetical protein